MRRAIPSFQSNLNRISSGAIPMCPRRLSLSFALRLLLSGLLLGLCLGAWSAPLAAAAAAPDPTYAALRAARPDGRRVPVSGLTLSRDAFQFRFDSGAFHFLAPVEGRTLGAVFVGRGS